MAIGTNLFYYTANGWIPAKLRSNIPGNQLNKFRIYVPEMDTCLNVPAMAVRMA